MRASWDWLLCDGAGNALAELTTATGKMLTYKRNYYAEGTLQISHEDAAALPFLEAVEKGPWPTLRCYRRGATTAPSAPATLRFNGTLSPFTEELEESGTITATFRSPFSRLVGDGSSNSGRFTREGLTAEEINADDIAASLVKLYGGLATGVTGGTDPSFNEAVYEEAFYAGLGIGVIAKTSPRFVTYKYANVGQAIIFLSQMIGGFDFQETYVDGGGTTLALFNTYASLGELKPNLSFQYGPGTLANVRKVERQTSPPVNTARLLGSNNVSGTNAGMAASLAAFGKYFTQSQATGTPTQEALEARVVGMLRAHPVKVLTLQPELEASNCPQLFDDFGIGDTVPFYGKRGAFVESNQGRINEIQVAIDENGYETASMPTPESMNEARGVDEMHTSFTVETGNAN